MLVRCDYDWSERLVGSYHVDSRVVIVSVRQVKLAYVHTEAKAPPQVRRKQARHGTGHGVVVAPPPSIRPAKMSSSSSTSTPSPMKAAVVSPRKSSMFVFLW